MASRGTEIARGYVGVTVDGDGINEEIVGSVNAAGDGVEQAGEDHGERYGDGFSEGFFDRMKKAFKKGFNDRINADVERAGSEGGEHFTNGMTSHFSDLRERLSAELDAVTERSEGLRKSLDRVRTQGGRDRLTESLRESRSEATRLTGQLRTLASTEARLHAQINRVSGNGRGSSLGDRLGGLFGAGSRNNVLNLFGKSLGGIINLFDKAREAGAQMFATFSRGFTQAGEGASFLQKAMAGFGELGTSLSGSGGGLAAALVEGWPAAVAAILAIVAALSVLASVIGALIGLITALAATIAGALTGALLVAGGAAVALVASIGLLVNAFTSMTDAQKKAMGATFMPMREELAGIGQIMITQIIPYFDLWAGNLQVALANILPLAQAMGVAFGQAGDIITAALGGPGMLLLLATLKQELPGIVVNLSMALSGFLNGMAALFAAIMPYVTQFSFYLAQVADRFAAWSSSAQGQNAITSFVDRALVSLTSLWNFTQQVFGFIGDLLFNPTSMAAGNSIFDSMARTFSHFRDIVAEAAANGDLQRWFQDAINFGSQLWSVIEALGGTFIALYNSGTLQAVGEALGGIADVINFLNPLIQGLVALIGPALAGAVNTAILPLQVMEKTLAGIGNAAGWVGDRLGFGGSKAKDLGNQAAGASQQVGSLAAMMYAIPNINRTITISIQQLVYKKVAPAPLGAGAGVLDPQHGGGNVGAQFSIPNPPTMQSLNLPQGQVGGGGGGRGGGRRTPKYHNPYVAFANRLIKNGPSIAAQVRNAILTVNKQVRNAIMEATDASDAAAVKSSLDTIISNMTTSGEQMVNTAQQALNNAATSLANASSKGAAKAALKKVKQAQRDLAAAVKNQKRIQAAAKIVAAQEVVDPKRVNQLVAGLKVQNATLADYAEARARVADMLQDANQKLNAAIQLRDDYKKQIADSIRAYGELTTATAQTIDGVEQALTATDINTNLQSRLDKIKKFQDDLRLLLANGLSDAAYKQIVDQGVDAGSTFAEALLDGGVGAIAQTNSLTDQINSIAETLGTETSSRLYQAGVDAAQGLVDGLTSLSAQLDAAAYSLGLAIANQIKAALGIKSPSRVLIAAMDEVGNGAVIGLDNQHGKVGAASDRFAEAIAVSPEVAAYAAQQSGAPVSGNQNDPRFRDLVVVTPTEDPYAVANEVLNEVTGRL